VSFFHSARVPRMRNAGTSSFDAASITIFPSRSWNDIVKRSCGSTLRVISEICGNTWRISSTLDTARSSSSEVASVSARSRSTAACFEASARRWCETLIAT
jgi:hypothetical protein